MLLFPAKSKQTKEHMDLKNDFVFVFCFVLLQRCHFLSNEQRIMLGNISVKKERKKEQFTHRGESAVLSQFNGPRQKVTY